METFIAAVMAAFWQHGVVYAAYGEEKALEAVGVVKAICDFVQGVEKALYEVGVVERWEWIHQTTERFGGRGGNAYLHLRIWSDDPDAVGVVMRPFIDGCDLRYIGPEEDRWNGGGGSDDHFVLDWDGDTFTEYGNVSCRPVPKSTWDGVVSVDWDEDPITRKIDAERHGYSF